MTADVVLGRHTGTNDPAPPDPVVAAIERLAEGSAVVVIADDGGSIEGAFVCAASAATPELISVMVRLTSGFLCVAMPEARADQLDLPRIASSGRPEHETSFGVSVDARDGISTGISARDRARTIQLLADPSTRPADLTRPGHIVPVRVPEGGALRRPGHSDAATDLVALSGIVPVAVHATVVSQQDPVRMAGMDELEAFCIRRDLPLVWASDVARYRIHHDRSVSRLPRALLPRLATQHIESSEDPRATSPSSMEMPPTPVIARHTCGSAQHGTGHRGRPAMRSGPPIR
jgi:3,4-dihydroxy 2-butanone 4-phosphate synthase/GTP cyclohydrolase II